MMGADLILAGGKLKVVHSPSADGRLRTLVARLQQQQSPEAGTTPWVVVPREVGQPLVIRPVHVPSLPPGASAILRLTDLEAMPALMGTPAAELFGLTPAELKVAEMLARGKDALEIATFHNRAVGTVRSQIKAVFAKTGTRRQSELASLMVRIAVRTNQVGGVQVAPTIEGALQ
jgi:DNA-binding CsgD family transcriptional regulator